MVMRIELELAHLLLVVINMWFHIRSANLFIMLWSIIRPFPYNYFPSTFLKGRYWTEFLVTDTDKEI